MPVISEAPGLFRLPVHTPFPVGPTNVYVLVGERLALFDTGIRDERTWRELVEGLAEIGRRPEDVELVVVSHAHIDHHGLADRFPQAELLAGAADLPGILDVPGHSAENAQVVDRLLGTWGVPEGHREEIAVVTQLDRWAGSAPWAREIAEGTRLEGFGETLLALAMPGHTRGLTCLLRPGDGVLLASDHLLPTITPNPGLYTEFSPAKSGLSDYLASLRRLPELDIAIVCPGHGEPFPFSAVRVEEIFAHHEERLEHVRELTGGGSTVFEVTSRVFQPRDALNLFLALREVFGHLEILQERGELLLDSENGLDRYLIA